MSDAETRALLEQVIQAADHDRSLLLSLVARVELYPDRILVWTILDPDPGEREKDAAVLRDVPLDHSSPPAAPSASDPAGVVLSTARNPRLHHGLIAPFYTVPMDRTVVFLLPRKKPARK